MSLSAHFLPHVILQRCPRRRCSARAATHLFPLGATLMALDRGLFPVCRTNRNMVIPACPLGQASGAWDRRVRTPPYVCSTKSTDRQALAGNHRERSQPYSEFQSFLDLFKIPAATSVSLKSDTKPCFDKAEKLSAGDTRPASFVFLSREALTAQDPQICITN